MREVHILRGVVALRHEHLLEEGIRPRRVQAHALHVEVVELRPRDEDVALSL